MVLNLPKDDSMLNLSGDNLLLMSTKSCHLLSEDALRSGQCLQSGESVVWQEEQGATSGIGSIEGTAGQMLSCQLVFEPAVAPLAAVDVESMDVLVQLGLPALHHRLSYSSICRE
ncbi:hypothetical protein CK203_082345 [Vitis vinifera]|uniref:Uncharacterized protein n=1 Tax=Vitis vinifera TaxID=29760 RepID=A0A438DSJ7_VITVI|nr:hypothetical protein CK203_082345 [Vitis vinifera]